ncbi:hypothetical protein A11A3_12955 [Alcanivorax hongdengensis A-11-3]|uniref:NolW-like domain-containing protein n=1 Tax=Alcanivorax hongdengensis A-11-3 TaxID=1177179 RepID=L0WC14_9GAMM|nr:hypothetical protein [Alcanivorax hongdengensis]EKF73637.1 hypothetical protein A11A3_12955 [Alcanivorax hongdengensis A-11-3]
MARHHRFLPFALLFFSLLGSLPAGAEDFHIHVLNRPDAAHLASVIEPMLPPGGSVRLYQGQLIIRTTDDNMAELQAALGQLDDKPVTVVVYLRRQGSSSQTQSRAQANVHIQIPDSSSGQIRFEHQQRQQQQLDQYHIRTLSGYPARITEGTLVALTGGWPRNTQLVALDKGIEVVPQLTRDGDVVLQISQSYDRPANGTVATEHSATTLRVTPGQWRPMGSIDVEQNQATRGLNGVSQSRQRVSIPLEVMTQVIR